MTQCHTRSRQRAGLLGSNVDADGMGQSMSLGQRVWPQGLAVTQDLEEGFTQPLKLYNDDEFACGIKKLSAGRHALVCGKIKSIRLRKGSKGR